MKNPLDIFIGQLSQLLKPYRPVIGPLASCLTVGQIFIRNLICMDIIIKGNTKGVSSQSFVTGLMIGILMTKYALMIEDFSMFVVSFSSILFNTVHVIVYKKYTRKIEREVQEPLRKAFTLIALIFLYSSWEKQEVLGERYGFMMFLIMFVINASDLISLKEKIRKKDASSINFLKCCTSSCGSFLWLLHGFIIKSKITIIQNLLSFLISFTEVVLYIKFYDDCPC